MCPCAGVKGCSWAPPRPPCLATPKRIPLPMLWENAGKQKENPEIPGKTAGNMWENVEKRGNWPFQTTDIPKREDGEWNGPIGLTQRAQQKRPNPGKREKRGKRVCSPHFEKPRNKKPHFPTLIIQLRPILHSVVLFSPRFASQLVAHQRPPRFWQVEAWVTVPGPTSTPKTTQNTPCTGPRAKTLSFFFRAGVSLAWLPHAHFGNRPTFPKHRWMNGPRGPVLVGRLVGGGGGLKRLNSCAVHAQPAAHGAPRCRTGGV